MSVLTRLLSEGFRAFFLAAIVFAVVSIAVWSLWLAALVTAWVPPELPFGPLPALWHGHEMVFGYGAAAVGGFLLTAVPGWTGSSPGRRGYVTAAAGFWLAGRVAVWLAPVLPPVVVALADLAFVPILIAQVASQLARRPKPKNMVFLGFLSVFWLANLRVHLAWGSGGEGAVAGLEAGLLALGAMIAVLGGRVTPAFTRNAMKRACILEGWPVSRRPLDMVAIVGVSASALMVLADVPEPVVAPVLILAGLAQVARLAGWRTGYALGQPILWSLHLGMAMLGLALLALGLAGIGLVPRPAALHLLGIGAVGGMTLAVMSRAILGHTGRALVAPGPVALAYGAVAMAALLRAGAEWTEAAFQPWLLLGSAALWLLAFALTLAALAPALAGPRAHARATASETGGSS